MDISQPDIDPGYRLSQYTDQIFCRCPKCDQQALIISNPDRIRVSCLGCTYQEDWNSQKIYADAVGIAEAPCPTCGSRLKAKQKAKANKRRPLTIVVNCTGCKQSANIKLHWQKDQEQLYGNNPIDPFFGFALWLQIECCNNILWVYNEQHLAILKFYVTSKDSRSQWSMISRLPKWILVTKNRDAILKCLDRMERKLLEL
jgi:hypothetical protein